ncbi:ABC transporter ATP-binding protein [Wenzhouxiangella sp. XN79A]|uniref:ABC transporter ATP-binding protein n=1 Tax=Wenzhouxiangella sp. XN79A TaxID=2724193 RepID=UPI00144AD8B8|nr:ABC transporter ATP-binding protein [Wenzhouxiangella sp. XN79A]NKI33641.1 ABC transporter ATP-binding protein [Wenzhouxiangella sp. XN79A]
MTARLAVAGLDVTIGGVRRIEGLTLTIEAGQSWGVLGPNGAGKTTLLRTLAGLHPPAAGSVELDGRALETLSRRSVARTLGMLTQNTQFAFDATGLEIALIGRHPHRPAWGRERRDDVERARAALDAVGLSDMADRSCMQLSGGEQRRLALAVVLAQDPDVLLLDEPTNHLDPAVQVAVLDRLWRRVHGPGRVQVMALHDVNLATCYCNHVLLVFGDGRWRAGPTAELLTEAHLSELFGCPIRAVSDGRQTVFAVAGATG